MKLKTRFSKAVVLGTCATMGALVVSDTRLRRPSPKKVWSMSI